MRFRRQSPADAEARTDAKARADAAAEHAEMARFAVEDGSDGNEVEHRRSKAIRVAKGQRIKPRDEPDSDRD
ncbi:hypothetical protein ACFC58_36130 [Kitasatospora purpeofusca]|uniref:hypothetical protein n=1 Tax=Kitasatospora purpeofusca TaxID=67352 RepID=UPI0035DF7A36